MFAGGLEESRQEQGYVDVRADWQRHLEGRVQ